MNPLLTIASGRNSSSRAWKTDESRKALQCITNALISIASRSISDTDKFGRASECITNTLIVIASDKIADLDKGGLGISEKPGAWKAEDLARASKSITEPTIYIASGRILFRRSSKRRGSRGSSFGDGCVGSFALYRLATRHLSLLSPCSGQWC